MQVSRKIQAALLAAAVAYGSGAGAHEFPAGQDSDIRAYGHDPAWTLDIAGASGKLTLTLDGVTSSYKIPGLGPSIYREQLKMVYRVPNDRHVLTVIVKGETCRDVPTGKSHEVTVIVAQDGRGYAGCGDVLNR